MEINKDIFGSQRVGAVAAIGPDHVVQKPLELVSGRKLESLEMLASKAALKCCKPTLVGDSGPSSEDLNVGCKAAGKGSGGFSSKQEIQWQLDSRPCVLMLWLHICLDLASVWRY